MGQNLRIKLTKLIEKLPEAVISSLLEQAESYHDARVETSRPACPHCGNTHIVKNGHKCGKQEYLCKDCGFTFVSTMCSLNVKTVSKDVYAGHIKTHMAVRE